MSQETLILITTAASIGLVHTLLGPDHYLPFITLSKARQWSIKKTALITTFCGLGHVLSSIILGFVGISFGVALLKLKIIEGFRGDLAAWLLIMFGFTYFIWGIRRALKNKSHEHLHTHDNEETHSHSHTHFKNHSHIHNFKTKKLTPWILFIIFIFGPCEPLIPLIMYPAAKNGIIDVILVALVFGIVTIATMLSIVIAGAYGLSFFKFEKIKKYSHALAGFFIFLCGGAIKFLGL